MISFGQGCEGEPLCEAAFLEELLKEVRRQTQRGTLHMNTNGYAPEAIRRLARAGLDSIRISLNSAQEGFYHAYHKPKGYQFADVVKSAQTAAMEGLFVSINYLVFPGLTDHPDEIDAFTRFLEHARPHMVQWKNLNIDPDQYISCLGLDRLSCSLGVRRTIGILGLRMPHVRFGYFNVPREQFATATT
jgi:pyruvate-formate lyase-activating enzyme